MIKPKLLKNYRGFTGQRLESFAGKVLASLTGNAHFPDPSPSLPVLSDAIEVFADSIAVTATGFASTAAERSANRLRLVAVLDDLALCIQQKSRLNEAVMVSSGYQVSMRYGKAPSPEKPGHVRIGLGVMPGQLWLKWKRDPGQKLCIYQYAVGQLTQSTQWQTAQVGTRSNHLFKGLPSGQRVWLRVLIIGSENQEVVSDPVSMIVQ